MARTSATTPPTNATPRLHPNGDYLCHVVGVDIIPTSASWFLQLTLLTDVGTARVDVRGVQDNGKGVWVERVASALAYAVAPSLPPVPGAIQPFQDYDWEAECDLRAALLGGCCWLTIGAEAGGERAGGGTWPDKQTARWLDAARAAEDDIKKARATDAFKAEAPRIKAQRTRAIEEWHIGLERAAAGGSAAADNDDDIDF